MLTHIHLNELRLEIAFHCMIKTQYMVRPTACSFSDVTIHGQIQKYTVTVTASYNNTNSYRAAIALYVFSRCVYFYSLLHRNFGREPAVCSFCWWWLRVGNDLMGCSVFRINIDGLSLKLHMNNPTWDQDRVHKNKFAVWRVCFWKQVLHYSLHLTILFDWTWLFVQGFFFITLQTSWNRCQVLTQYACEVLCAAQGKRTEPSLQFAF